MTTSALDNVPGLGETRRKALLRHFGSLKRLAAATPEEITEVPGIGRRTAEAVLAALETPAAGKDEAAEAGAFRGRRGGPDEGPIPDGRHPVAGFGPALDGRRVTARRRCDDHELRSSGRAGVRRSPPGRSA